MDPGERELERALGGPLERVLSEARELEQQPEDDPAQLFRKKYAARAILEDARAKVAALAPSGPREVALGLLDTRLGLNHWRTEEPHNVEGRLSAGARALEGRSEHLGPLLDCFNTLGLLWYGRRCIEKSAGYFEKAERAFDSAAGGSQREPAVQRRHTLTLFYLAQVYTHLGDRERASHFLQATLERQLSSGDFNVTEWVRNAARMAEYHASEGRLAPADRLLRAARALLARPSSSSCDPSVVADVDVACARLCTAALQAAAARPEEGGVQLQRASPPPSPSLPSPAVLAGPAGEDLTASTAPIAPAAPATVAEARALHDAAHDCLARASAHYVLDGYASVPPLNQPN
eukprot:tig00000331_g24145.t1